MIFVCLPCLNEAKSLEILIPEIKNILKINYKILICYDFSTDNTKELIENMDDKTIELLEYKNERGLGFAFKRLFLKAIDESNNKDDIIITMDADNTHNPEGFLEIIKKINDGNDLVIQSRFCNTSYISGFSGFRTLISKSVSLYMRTFFPVEKVKDYTSSYRGYRVEILSLAFEKCKPFITEREFTYTCETMVKINKITNKIVEIPISYKYEKKIGKSKLELFKNAIGIVILTFKLVKFKIMK